METETIRLTREDWDEVRRAVQWTRHNTRSPERQQRLAAIYDQLVNQGAEQAEAALSVALNVREALTQRMPETFRGIVTREAEAKFGEVVDVQKIGPGSVGGFYLLIKRKEPARDDLPYMTIRGIVALTTGNAEFHWGHYDMTREDAKRDLASRLTSTRTARATRAGWDRTRVGNTPSQ